MKNVTNVDIKRALAAVKVYSFGREINGFKNLFIDLKFPARKILLIGRLSCCSYSR